ncbi:hypothetical protein I4A91_002220 [Enterobacter hormaechei]|nr:hypothetical protein [Enterobacter hormaechei]
MTETVKTDTDQTISGKFEMLPVEALSLLGKKIRTPDDRVEKIDGDDLVWWMFFFTFLHQKTPCYQTRKTISDRFDCDERTVSRRTARLEKLGLLSIEKRKGTSCIYTATSVEQFLMMKTEQKVTPKEESDGEETKKQPVQKNIADAPETAAPVAGIGKSIPDVADHIDADLSAGNDPSLSEPAGENVVKFPLQKASFKPAAPDDEEPEESYLEYAGYMGQNTYYEPSQADFDKAEAILYGGKVV